MALKPCLDCGRPSDQARCSRHRRVVTQRKRERRPYTNAERTRRANTVAVWVGVNGWICPGWQRDAHPSTDLTADHLDPVGAGGHEGGPLGVLCRSCNGRKQARA